MSEKGENLTRRSSFRKALADAALPPEYLDKLEQKRKQLDESIHKYIASKEREYKQFEKDVKQQHKLAQGQNGPNGKEKRSAGLSAADEQDQVALLESQRISAVDALLGTSTTPELNKATADTAEYATRFPDRSTIAGLKDRGASVERDRDFVGLFTPPYLPALQANDGQQLERTTSDPQIPDKANVEQNTHCLERAYSDSVTQAKVKRPSQLILAHRTSSSGSSADGKLASAMRTTTERTKRKRVSLAVGDAIVAPSDSVPNALAHNSTPSHSRIRAAVPEREFPGSTKRSSAEEQTSTPAPADEASASGASYAENAITENDEDLESLSQSRMATTSTSTQAPSSSTKIDPDGDLFDLHDESDVPQSQLEDDSVFESDDDITGRVDGETIPENARYDATTGIVPEPENGEDSAVPYLAFGQGSAVASQQPTQPGFRRPSVVSDPVFRGGNYAVAEQDAVENEVYGSSFNRPSKGSFTAGSLGESYMAQHAEEMMKLRSSRQQTQAKA